MEQTRTGQVKVLLYGIQSRNSEQHVTYASQRIQIHFMRKTPFTIQENPSIIHSVPSPSRTVKKRRIRSLRPWPRLLHQITSELATLKALKNIPDRIKTSAFRPHLPRISLCSCRPREVFFSFRTETFIIHDSAVKYNNKKNDAPAVWPAG